MSNHVNRFVWVYHSWSKKYQRVEVHNFISPDKNSHTLGTPTPYTYNLVRDQFRYTLFSDQELSKPNAVAIAKEAYECEFVKMSPALRRKQRK